jgi:hypothetical protein
MFGKVAMSSNLGYIDDVEIFDDVYTMKVVAKSTMHSEAVSRLCGSESLNRLGETRKISVFAWLATGGDLAKFQDRHAVAPQLHTLEPLPGTRGLPPKAVSQEHYCLLTPAGPVWAVRDIPSLFSDLGAAAKSRAGAA